MSDKTYRENFDEIEWSRPVGYYASKNTHRILGRDEIIQAGDEFWSARLESWQAIGSSVGYAVGHWFGVSVAVRRPR